MSVCRLRRLRPEWVWKCQRDSTVAPQLNWLTCSISLFAQPSVFFSHLWFRWRTLIREWNWWFYSSCVKRLRWCFNDGMTRPNHVESFVWAASSLHPLIICTRCVMTPRCWAWIPHLLVSSTFLVHRPVPFQHLQPKYFSTDLQLCSKIHVVALFWSPNASLSNTSVFFSFHPPSLHPRLIWLHRHPSNVWRGSLRKAPWFGWSQSVLLWLDARPKLPLY